MSTCKITISTKNMSIHVLTCKRYLINLKIEASSLAKVFFFKSNPFMGNGKYIEIPSEDEKEKKIILISNNRHLRYHLCDFLMSINISKYTFVYCSTKRYKFRENQRILRSVKIFPPYFIS